MERASQSLEERKEGQRLLVAEVENFFQEDMPVHVRQRWLAQRGLNYPHESAQWLIAFEDYLPSVKSISILQKRNPKEAQRRISRTLRKVPFAALTTLVFDRVLERIMPTLDRGEPLCPNPDKRPYSFSHRELSGGKIRHLEGNAAAFVRYMEQLLTNSWDDILADITQPNHRYYPLWECFEAAHNAFFYPKARAVFSAQQQCYIPPKENALTALTLLTHIRAEYAEECADRGVKPSTHEVTLRALRSAHRIGWAATGNAASIGEEIAADNLAERFLELESCPAEELHKLGDRKRLVVPTNDPGQYGYNHPSLTERPWAVDRNCPAAPWLESPDRRPVEALDNYITTFQRSLLPPALQHMSHDFDSTLFFRATVLLQVGSLVGIETIFKEWEG